MKDFLLVMCMKPRCLMVLKICEAVLKTNEIVLRVVECKEEWNYIR